MGSSRRIVATEGKVVTAHLPQCQYWRLGSGFTLALLLLACEPSPRGNERGAAPPPSGPTTEPGAATASPPPLMKARGAFTTYSAASVPWWVALDGGFFREQGLDVELVHVDAGAALLAAMSNGELDITGGGGPGTVLGNLQGLQLYLIGVNLAVLEGELFVRPEIRTLEDLRGKTVGVNRPKAISDVTARMALERLGLQPDVDVFTRGTGGQVEALASMETGTTEAASLNPPFVFEARRRGFRSLVNIGELRIPFIAAGISAHKRVLDERPALGDRYLRALAQAKSRIRTDRELTIQVLGKYTQTDDRDVLSATVDYYAPLYPIDSYPEPVAVQAVLDLEEHPAARTARPEDVVDYRFAERLRSSGFLDGLGQQSPEERATH
jgi:NitT/TauT family transport system substrate-binding protein